MAQLDFEKAFGNKHSIELTSGKPLSKDDQELMAFLEESIPKIAVIGTGGSGSNTISRLAELGVAGAKVIAMNTDAQHLMMIKAEKKVLLGRMKTKGRGAGSNPEVGEAAALEAKPDIEKVLEGYDLVFVTCGMGGGTGTGSAHVIANVAKARGALVIAVVTLPFTSEGTKRMRNAMVGLEKLKKEADTTIVIPNDKLLYFVADLPLNSAFKTSDMVLANSVKGIAELITKPGLVNLDFADVRTILEKSGSAMIGLGEVSTADQRDKVLVAAEKALSSPLLDLDIAQADKVLVNITGGSDMTLGEAEAAVQSIAAKVAKDAHIIWGAAVDNAMQTANVRVLAVLAGIKEDSPRGEGQEPIDLDFI
ncbi:MAG TPA: cell division protein FtsZ [Candidatus Norongarragalinales archaeon]|nr:cell division protein FtsZ [Candidatus Norongarragalinales archaeon]